MTIIGTIESIEYRCTNGHEKKVVTIVPNHLEKAFVEFRGRNMDLLTGYHEGLDVKAKFFVEGRTSKSSGIQFNNLVATEIQRFDYNNQT